MKNCHKQSLSSSIPITNFIGNVMITTLRWNSTKNVKICTSEEKESSDEPGESYQTVYKSDLNRGY